MNVHFGCWRPGIDVFDREAMLEQMNVEVVRRCQLGRCHRPMVLDLGCGVGAVLRTVRRHFPTSFAIGITLVEEQAAVASRFATGERSEAPPVLVGDFLRTPLRERSVYAAFAVESSCYAPGLAKRALLREMARVTMAGGRMVVADAMLRHWPLRSPITDAAHRRLCDAWALDTLGHLGSFVDAAEDAGFCDIVVEDISRNVFPSLLHVPFVAAQFFAEAYIRSARLSPDRVRNALAGFPLAALALDPSAVGYFIISGNRC
jgi:SAM-dependent methyltransferase